MSERVLNILVIEDRQTDFLLIERHLLKQQPAIRCVRVDAACALEGALDAGGWDLVLADFNVPELDFYESLGRIRSRRQELPVILVSGSVGEEQAVELLKLGVSDFVLKDNLTRLVPAIERALREAADLRVRRAAEEALRESEEFNRQIVNNAEEGIIVYGTDLTYQRWNPYMERLSGRSAGEVIGRHPLELFPFLEKVGVIERIGRVLEGEPAATIEFPFQVPGTGHQGWASDTSSPLKNAHGEVIGVIAVVRDITTRKLVEDALRKLFVAVEQSPVMVIIFDRDGFIEFINPCYCRMTGYTRDEVLGSVAFGRETIVPALRRELWETIRGGATWEGNIKNRKRDGTVFWEHATVSPIRDAAGEITHYLAVKEDITERRNLEEQLRQSQKMEAVGQLAGGVAHDFNNIMQVIVGYAQLQQMTDQDHGVDVSSLAEIFKAVERGSSLTRSLMVFSRKQPLEVSSFDLNGLIRESMKLAGRLVTEDVRLSFDPFEGGLPVRGDAGLVQQILFNLVTNGRDAMDGAGKLTVVTARVTVDEILREASGIAVPAGNYALLSVSDTGCGIGDDIKGKIFEPFFTTKQVGKGTGLGLAMIHSTVSQMGGYITVDSTLGQGSAIAIYLPLDELFDARAPAGAAGREHTLNGRGETILVTEDDQGVLDSIAKILTLCNYRIIRAASPREAIALAREEGAGVALALLDIILPDMSGTRLLRELQAIRPGLPGLFLSGYSDELLEARGVNEHYLHKPLHPVQLLKQVRRILDQETMKS